MYKLIAKIVKDGKLIGYEIQDVNEERDRIYPEQAWELARNNMLNNIVADNNLKLKGLNGMNIDKLPVINIEGKNDINIDNIDVKLYVMAAVLREVLNGKLEVISGQELAVATKNIKNHIEKYGNNGEHGGLLVNLDNSIGKSLKIVNKLTSGGRRPEFLGVSILNIGDRPIAFRRVMIINHTIQMDAVINPGQTVLLNKIEFSLLALREGVNLQFANGIAALGLVRSYNIDRLLHFMYPKYNDIDDSVSVDIHSLVDDITLRNYFIDDGRRCLYK